MTNSKKKSNESLESICKELTELNNTLIKSKLKPKEIRSYVRTELRTDARNLRRLYNEEFKNIQITDPLKQEVYILLVKLGILKNIKLPTMEQLRDNESVCQYSTDELTEEELPLEEKE